MIKNVKVVSLATFLVVGFNGSVFASETNSNVTETHQPKESPAKLGEKNESGKEAKNVAPVDTTKSGSSSVEKPKSPVVKTVTKSRLSIAKDLIVNKKSLYGLGVITLLAATVYSVYNANTSN